MLVYAIKNLVNGKFYVGQTINSIEYRWMFHKIEARKCDGSSKRLICRAIRKYGENNFALRVLTPDCVTKGHLNSLETYWIKRLRSNDPKYGYNLTIGGEGRGKGYKLSKRSRRKISRALLGKSFSDERRKKISKALTGRYISKKTRRKLSLRTKAYLSTHPEINIRNICRMNAVNARRRELEE